LGKDGKPFKTRSGATVGLENLLDEAVQRARAIVAGNDDVKKNGPELSEQERDQIANVIGHAAIKYADLSHNRTSDYEFDEEKMVAMQGNTATYMQYSFARVNGIFRRGNVDIDALRAGNVAIRLDHPQERALALALLRFSDALAETVEDYRPNVLTGYLYELTKVFSGFFEHCPVLKAETEAIRDSRLLLCDLTGCTIRKGLSLLGIGVVERM
jgi:arginyl-tRNA synthetase